MSERTATRSEMRQQGSSLSPGQRRLIHLIQQVGFGAVEGLCVRAGQPVFEPVPRITRELKFGCRETTPIARTGDRSRIELLELLDALSELGNGTIDRIEVRHGLPFRMVTSSHLSREMME